MYILPHIGSNDWDPKDELSITKGSHEGKIPVVYFFVNLTAPYQNAMFRLTAKRF